MGIKDVSTGLHIHIDDKKGPEIDVFQHLVFLTRTEIAIENT